ncbi:hypothetical protein XELAEV_18041070mg [Xenopus laevis]|uniref:Uncharacterized protein n=1 Tax=Xenopus laevis TaxID=8355 RepID=A0A974H562_XENLA|nr:hypothetical protein XELAEV_18041070mg [Xenopus laevis]
MQETLRLALGFFFYVASLQYTGLYIPTVSYRYLNVLPYCFIQCNSLYLFVYSTMFYKKAARQVGELCARTQLSSPSNLLKRFFCFILNI